MIETNQFLTPGSAPFDAGYHAGQVAGRILAYVLLAALAGKCFSIARRPAANTKCALSLGVLLCSLGVASLIGTVVGQLSPALRVLAVLGGFATLLVIIATVVLAIVGLVEYRTANGRYTQGRAQAIWTLSLAFCFLCLTLFGFVRALQAGLSANGRAAQANQPAAGQWLVFDDLNFKIRSPGKPWVQLDAKKINKSAAVAFTRTQPQVFFMIIAEKAAMNPALTSESIVEIAKANLRSATVTSQELKEIPMRRQGLDGVLMETDAQTRAYRTLFRHWICATNGYVYQIVAWGSFDDAAAVRVMSEELYSSFTLLDFQRQVSGAGNGAADFHSDLFGYGVKMGGSGWRPSPLTAKDIPAAEFAAWDEYKNVGLFVIPVCLMGQDPQAEAATQALCDAIALAYPGPDVHDEKPVVQGKLSGVEFGYDRPGTQGRLVYRVRVLKDEQWAYLLGAYYEPLRKDDGAILEEALARVEFPEQPAPPSNLAQQFSQQDKRRHGLFFNNTGLFYYKERQFEKSVACFQTAIGFDPQSGVYLVNAANALENAGKRRDALDLIESNPSLLAANQAVRAARADLQFQLELVDSALTNYSALFAEGFRNENSFVNYVILLNQTRQQDLALSAVENYLKENDSAAVGLVLAKLYEQKKNVPKAIELLKEQTRKHPYNVELSLSLADAYCQAGLYSDAAGICQQLIDSKSDTAGALYLKGCCEFGLKRYREAKATFETALKEDPASAKAKSYLDLVSGMLGEGSNSALQDAIVAVSVPDKLLSATPPAAPPSYTKDYGARYLKDITAISFTPKKEFKRTDYCSIQVLDSSGIAACSTMQFEFDPLSEAIFVNNLSVKDQDGQVVATGSRADYYVVDAHSTTPASQKKILNIPISGLRPGSLIDLTVTRQDLAPPDEFPFTEHACITSFPILEDILLIRGETNALKFAGLGAGDNMQSEGALYWEREHPEIYKWEPMEQAPADFAPALCIGDATATWEGETRNYLQVLGDYFGLDAPARELAGNLVKNASGESGKVFRLAGYVQTNCAYKALEFGRRARLPHKTAEILHNHYGDCKDHALLLQQMLEASGIPARLALVRTQGKVRKELPTLDQFDHMIVYLPAFQNGFFIDCTDKGSDLSQAVPLGLAGKEALILDAANPRFVVIPDYPAGCNVFNSRREVRITNGTDVAVHEVLSLKGCGGSQLRAFFKGLQPEARRNFVELQLNRQSGAVTSFELENLEDTQAPLVLDMDYILKRQFHLTGNQLVGKLPDVWEQVYAAAEPVELRTTPFELSFPIEVESTILLAIPQGCREPALEDFRQNVQTAFATGRSEARKEGAGLQIDYRLQRRAGKFTAAEYGPYQDDMVKALGPLEQVVAFTKTP
jgi:tetratricopeptide (TPR) repeat protein